MPKYHILAQREDGNWGVAFGAYNHGDVEFEREDYRSHGVKAKDLKIITLRSAKQSVIDDAIARLNGDADDLRDHPGAARSELFASAGDF